MRPFSSRRDAMPPRPTGARSRTPWRLLSRPRARRGAVGPTGLIIGGVSLLALVIGWAVLRPRPVPAPAGFETYASTDHIFTCAAPVGWRRVESEGHNSDTGAVDSADVPGGVLFGQGSATIDVTTGRMAEVLKNELLSSGGPVPESMTGSRAVALHRQDRAKLKLMMQGVTLEPSRSFTSAFGECVSQEWRGRSKFFGWGGPQHGYLMSMVNGDHTATVTCQCAETDWPTLKPAFLHVVNSVAYTGPVAPALPSLSVPSMAIPSLPQPPSQ